VVVLIHLQHILLLLLLPTLLLLPARCHLHILLLTLNITLQCTCAPTSPLRRCVWSSTYTCSTSRTAAAAAAAARYTLPLASAAKRVWPHLAIEALCVVIHVHLQHLYAALRVAAVHSGLQDNTAAAPSNSKPAADSNF
jgi:hypothetical protein